MRPRPRGVRGTRPQPPHIALAACGKQPCGLRARLQVVWRAPQMSCVCRPGCCPGEQNAKNVGSLSDVPLRILRPGGALCPQGEGVGRGGERSPWSRPSRKGGLVGEGGGCRGPQAAWVWGTQQRGSRTMLPLPVQTRGSHRGQHSHNPCGPGRPAAMPGLRFSALGEICGSVSLSGAWK